MEKFNLVVTLQELDTIYKSLLEMPAKYSLPVLQKLEIQVKEQQEIKPETEEKTE